MLMCYSYRYGLSLEMIGLLCALHSSECMGHACCLHVMGFVVCS